MKLLSPPVIHAAATKYVDIAEEHPRRP